jgi:YggT family protein
VSVVCALLQLYVLALFVRIVLSWFTPEPGSAVGSVERFLASITDPVLLPVRRIMPRTGMLDLSPIVVLIVIQIVQQAICS